jgi:hypothetical protein
MYIKSELENLSSEKLKRVIVKLVLWLGHDSYLDSTLKVR